MEVSGIRKPVTDAGIWGDSVTIPGLTKVVCHYLAPHQSPTEYTVAGWF